MAEDKPQETKVVCPNCNSFSIMKYTKLTRETTVLTCPKCSDDFLVRLDFKITPIIEVSKLSFVDGGMFKRGGG